MSNKNREYLEFLISHEVPPKNLAVAAKKDILLSFHSRSIVTKFIFFQLLGAAFSLTFCPQFGLGLPEGHGISHVFRMIGDWACAAFCGSLFLSSGAIMAMLGMKGEELWWIWRRFKFSLVLFPATMWATLMLANLSLQLQGENLIYHLIWMISAILVQYLWLQIRSRVYDWNLLAQSI
jgi:hypothetical protein